MSLYTQWTDMVVDYVKTKGENAFWAEYSKLEKAIYKDLLANHKTVKTTTINDLAKEYDSTIEFIMGFIDGINDSLKNQYDLETLEADSKLELDINLETLYYNMLDAKAEYLYTLLNFIFNLSAISVQDNPPFLNCKTCFLISVPCSS